MILRRHWIEKEGYKVLSSIGKGRYGVCFLAFDKEGRKVVLKRFRPHMLRKNKAYNHYEAVILSDIDHEAMPRFLGVVNSRSGYYFILEHKEGLSLSEWIFKRKKVFTLYEIYTIIMQLLDILEYLHQKNIVHGDISISNIIYKDGNVSLIDFGLARYTDDTGKGFDIDYAYTAEVLLYMLYTGYDGRGNRPWYEELTLAKDQKDFIKKMMDPSWTKKLSKNKNTIKIIKREFEDCFGSNKIAGFAGTGEI